MINTKSLDILLNQLNTSGLQHQNSALFQVISELIKSLRKVVVEFNNFNAISGGGGSSIGSVINIGGTSGPPGMMGFDGEDGMIGPPGLGRNGLDGIALYDFGGNTIEWVQSPIPTWVSANARQISIDGGSGGGIHVLTVRIRAASGNVTARLRDITNNTTAGTSGVVASPNYGTEVFNVALSPGIAIYEVQLLPSIASTDVNLGSAYMDAAPSFTTSIGPAGLNGSMGPMGMGGEDAEFGMIIPGQDGHSVTVYEQSTEPAGALPGDIWITP